MQMLPFKILVVMGCWVSINCAVGQDFSVPLTVREPTGTSRINEPVTGGIPLPPGRFKKGQSFALFDREQQIPLQATPLVVDPKGFVRWILLDFQTDLQPNQEKPLTLRAAASGALTDDSLIVNDSAQSVEIDTGVIRLIVSKREPFRLWTASFTAGKQVTNGGEVSYTDSITGQKHLADRPDEVKLEYNGPLRATILVRGGFADDPQSQLGYEARFTAWAGSSQVHVKYALTNSNPDHYCYRRIADSSIRFHLTQTANRVILGAATPMEVVGDGVLHQGLISNAVGSARAANEDQAIWTNSSPDEKAEGWIAAMSGDARVAVCDLFFTDDPPRRLSVAGNSIQMSGVAERFDGEKGFLPFLDKHRWLLDCSRLSSEYMIDLNAPRNPEALSAWSRSCRARTHVLAAPSWVSETDSLAIGKFGTLADELDCYRRWNWQFDLQEIPTHPGRKVIARYKRGEDNHYETEQDTIESLLLLYLRSGSRPYFEAAQGWANYSMDLREWRTDRWQWKDGGVWWVKGGPLGNRPQRSADPITGLLNRPPMPWSKTFEEPFSEAAARDLYYLGNSKSCYCHTYAAGLATWYCLTGERDALDAAVDSVEQNLDTQRRARGRRVGQWPKGDGVRRDFVRSCYVANSVRLVVPNNPLVVEASEYLTQLYLQRPVPEPRGLVNSGWAHQLRGDLDSIVGPKGLAEMKRLGVEYDSKTSQLTNTRTGQKWFPIHDPATFEYPSLSKAIDCYRRITGSEDAHDWLIAHGKAFAQVLHQPLHGLLQPTLLVDFPALGVAKDHASWRGIQGGEGVAMSGYLTRFYPDAVMRAYALTREPLLKQRAYDLWDRGSHRNYYAKTFSNVGQVNQWVNCYGPHDETAFFTGRTFYEWAHPVADKNPPAVINDLRVRVTGANAIVWFTAPANARAARYQLKCSDQPIVDYENFLMAYAAGEGPQNCNWWQAKNLKGEPTPGLPRANEQFAVSSVPAKARYFAIRSFDSESRRSELSNVADVADAER